MRPAHSRPGPQDEIPAQGLVESVVELQVEAPVGGARVDHRQAAQQLRADRDDDHVRQLIPDEAGDHPGAALDHDAVDRVVGQPAASESRRSMRPSAPVTQGTGSAPAAINARARAGGASGPWISQGRSSGRRRQAGILRGPQVGVQHDRLGAPARDLFDRETGVVGENGADTHQDRVAQRADGVGEPHGLRSAQADALPAAGRRCCRRRFGRSSAPRTAGPVQPGNRLPLPDGFFRSSRPRQAMHRRSLSCSAIGFQERCSATGPPSCSVFAITRIAHGRFFKKTCLRAARSGDGRLRSSSGDTAAIKARAAPAPPQPAGHEVGHDHAQYHRCEARRNPQCAQRPQEHQIPPEMPSPDRSRA